MGFEGPLHRRVFDAVDDAPTTRAIVLTQGHFDHVGGVDCLRDEGTEVIAQANFAMWRADNERLEAFRSRNAAFAWMRAILAAMAYAESLGVGAQRPRPGPSRRPPSTTGWSCRSGDASSCCSRRPAARPRTSLVIWLPDSRTAFTGNLFGALFGHVPNLVTMRGDRYRDALTYVDSLDRVLDLGPERLLTGHFDPIDGADRIAAEITPCATPCSGCTTARSTG